MNNKGLDLLLDACRDIKNELLNHSIQIQIYGSVESRNDESYLQRTIFKYGLENIISIYGPVFNNEKDTILYEGDVFIQTSRHEGFPMSILEAFTYGCPVGITEGTNVDKIVNNENAGWICKTSVEAIKIMLLEIINSSPNVISEKSENARRLTEVFSWEQISKKTIEEYEILLRRV